MTAADAIPQEGKMTDEERHAIMTAFGAAIRVPGQNGAACRLDAEVMIAALRRNGFALVPLSGEAFESFVGDVISGLLDDDGWWPKSMDRETASAAITAAMERLK